MLRDYALERDSATLEFISTAHEGMKVSGRSFGERVGRQGVGMFRVVRRVHHRLLSRSVDVVHVTGTGQLSIVRDVAVLLTARLLGVPTVYHLRFGRVPDIARRRTTEWRALALPLRLATAVMVIDQGTERALRERLSGLSLRRIPNPVVVDALESQPGASRTVVFAGWVTPLKGVDELLEAWEDVARRHPDWTLELLGPVDRDYEMELRSRHAFAGVVMRGGVPHQEALTAIRGAGVFVLPSHTEGFPNVILEAMAGARPVVATSVGAIPEMLREGAGLIVPPRDATALGEALESAISQPEMSRLLGVRGRRRVLEEYSLYAVFEQYLTVWRSLAASASPTPGRDDRGR